MEVLQASKSHENCACDYACGCAQTGKCGTCKPPIKFLRFKTCPRSFMEKGSVTIDAGTCIEEIEVPR